MTATRVSQSEINQMMRELDEIAADRGIVWGAAEQANTDTAERSHYKKPGTVSGRGITRLVSAKQVNYIKRLMRERDTAGLVRLPGSENIERMSLAGARDLIERLLACPELPVKASTPLRSEHASEAQISYLTSLINGRSFGAADSRLRDQAAAAIEAGALSKSLASAAISAFKVLPYAERASVTPLTTVAENVAKDETDRLDGIYAKGGKIYKVQYNRTRTNLYGKLFVPENSTEAVWDSSGNLSASGTVVWEYVGSFARLNLTAADKMSIEEAKKFGALYGTCINCGRTLTDEKSIEAGIGPVCAKAFA
jgi:hypothetical protein